MFPAVNLSIKQVRGKFRLTTNYQYKAQQKWLKVGWKIALFYSWTHESRLSPDSSPDSLWLLLDSRTRTRTLAHWTRTRTLVQWTRTRTRTLIQWTRTHTWWTRALAWWTRTRTRTLALWTRTHCRTHESGLTPTLLHSVLQTSLSRFFLLFEQYGVTILITSFWDTHYCSFVLLLAWRLSSSNDVGINLPATILNNRTYHFQQCLNKK